MTKKEQTIKLRDELVPFSNFLDFSAIQKSLQPTFECQERMQTMLKNLQPAINMALEAHKQYQQFHAPLTREIVIPYHRPVEYDILGELRTLNDSQQEIIQNQQTILALREDSIDCLLHDTEDGSPIHVLAGESFSLSRMNNCLSHRYETSRFLSPSDNFAEIVGWG